MSIERQGTRSTKHDAGPVLLRRILKELIEIKEIIIKDKKWLQ